MTVPSLRPGKESFPGVFLSRKTKAGFSPLRTSLTVADRKRTPPQDIHTSRASEPHLRKKDSPNPGGPFGGVARHSSECFFFRSSHCSPGKKMFSLDDKQYVFPVTGLFLQGSFSWKELVENVGLGENITKSQQMFGGFFCSQCIWEEQTSIFLT